MKRSSSADYRLIGLSLKRVKISTSPGELRLDRDIDSLISGKRWTSTANLCGLSDTENHRGSSSEHRESRIHVELHSHHARLMRDPVDPLRLRLTCLHQTTSSSNNYDPTDKYNAQRLSSSPLPPERWTFLIQVPRMYPHVPPAITRVTRDFVPYNENLDANLDSYSSSASAAMVASSVMQGHLEPPVPKTVLINLLPPTLYHHHSRPQGGGVGDIQDFTEILDIDLATSVYNSWTPVSTLQDLLDFLMVMPARRWEWWGAESDRRRNHQQHQQRFFDGHPPVAQPTIAPAANSFSVIHQNQRQEHRLSIEQESHYSYQCEMDEDREVSTFESMMEDSPGVSGTARTERRVNPFTANRFDVGYEREANTRHYCEDVR